MIETLFRGLRRYLGSRAYFPVMGGQIIDASIVPVPKQRNQLATTTRGAQGCTRRRDVARRGSSVRSKRPRQKDTDARAPEVTARAVTGYKNTCSTCDRTARTGLVAALLALDGRGLCTTARCGGSGHSSGQHLSSRRVGSISAYRSAEIEATRLEDKCCPDRECPDPPHLAVVHKPRESSGSSGAPRPVRAVRAHVEHVFG